MDSMESDSDSDVQVLPVDLNNTTDSNSTDKDNEQASSNSSGTSSEGKRRSGVWSHFEQIKVGGISYAKCTYCKSTKYALAGNSKSGTGNMTRHLTAHHLNKLTNKSVSQKRIDVMLSTSNQNQKTGQEYSNEIFKKKLMKWIVDSDQPHTEVERVSFADLLKYLNPEVSTISADTIKNDLMTTFDKYRLELIEQIKNVPSKISFTHDVWTSPNQIPFMAIKGHWITEDWESKDMLIDFPHLKGRHTGENISALFRESLSIFNIGFEKIFAVTTDNTSNNDTFFRNMEQQSRAKNVDQFTESESRVRCAAHVLNLAVQTLLSNLSILPETSETEDEMEVDVDVSEENPQHESLPSVTVNKLRRLVKSIRKSVQKREKLADACSFHKIKEIQLIIDVKTRWNSTFSMLKRAITLKNPISTICSSDADLKNANLDGNEWAALTRVNILLEKFDRATQHLSMTRHPTISSVIPMYDWLNTELAKYIEHEKGPLSSAASKAKEKSMEYRPTIDDSAVLFLAVVLRPSLKLNYFKEHSELYDNRTQKKIKSSALDTFDNYYKSPKDQQDEAIDDDDLDDDFHKHANKRSRKENVLSDIQKYLAAPLASTKSNTLDWWKVHGVEFPDVSKMARDIMAAQATSVPVEREFSGGMDLIVSTRHRLKPPTITASMCLKSWWRNMDF